MKSLYHFLFAVITAALLLSACAAQPQTPAAQTGGGSKLIAQISDTATVSFTLKTGMKEGKMAFIGVGGSLDGQVDPDLKVKPGDVVEITLKNGDGVQHDLTIPDFQAQSDQVSTQDSQVKVRFRADKNGQFPYFCSVPGHRQAGMEGKLIVGEAAPQAQTAGISVVRLPDDLPGPLNRSTAQHVRVDLETVEVKARLADGVDYTYWTFNGKVPGPFIRVRVGDTVEVHLKNNVKSSMSHSIDLHAVIGPGGGAVSTQTLPGKETMFSFQALHPGLYVYHCATPMVAQHISNGMYGMILVEPEGGLPKVDHEFYVMQGELYTTEPMGQSGEDHFDQQKLLDEHPEYFVMNGSVGGLTKEHPLKAKVGETVRIFFGVGGPNFTSSFHVIGAIFDRVYDQGSLTSPPLTDVQTTSVAPGGATVVELSLQVPGRFILVDHALSRMERGLAGYLLVEGEQNPQIFNGQDMGNSGH